MTSMQHPVFLSYTKADRDRVEPFYDHLLGNGIQSWIDYKFIKPGQNWDFEIRRALLNAAMIVIFVSNNSVSKRGYVQRELRQALDSLKEKLIDDIYVLPVLLDDDVDVPTELASVQYTKASSEQCLVELTSAINSQLEKLGSQGGLTEGNSSIRWSFLTYKDFGDGLPGYELEFRLPQLHSEDFIRLNEITEIIRGDCLKMAMTFRENKFDPDISDFNYDQAKWARINTFSAICSEPVMRGRCVSIICARHYYYARAAHPNMEYKTYSFMLDPLFLIASVQQIFESPDAAFTIVRDEARRQLLVLETDDPDVEVFPLDRDVVERGTETWADFSDFVFREDHIEILFSPYQVASYAHGPQSIRLPYELIGPAMKNGYLFALDLDRHVWDKVE